MSIKDKLKANPELNRQLAKVFATADSGSGDRLVVRFDPDTLGIWPATVRRRTRTNMLKGALVTHYVSRPDKTPTGGRYQRRQFTVRYKGAKWYGTVKNGTDLVTLRRVD